MLTDGAVPGTIESASRSEEVVSSLDVFPTFSALAGVPLPAGVVYDGRDMREVLLRPAGRSKHTVLFLYSAETPSTKDGGPVADRTYRPACIFQDPIMCHKCMSKMAVKTSKDTHKSAAELGRP